MDIKDYFNLQIRHSVIFLDGIHTEKHEQNMDPRQKHSGMTNLQAYFSYKSSINP